LKLKYNFSEQGSNEDRTLLHNVESIVIDWTHQISKVLKRDSAQPILEGQTPSPMVELDFWKHRVNNLENIFDQVSSIPSYSINN